MSPSERGKKELWQSKFDTNGVQLPKEAHVGAVHVVQHAIVGTLVEEVV